MTADKAKEIIDLNIKEAGKKMPPDVKTALIIHSEALKLVIKCRAESCSGATSLLLGETWD